MSETQRKKRKFLSEEEKSQVAHMLRQVVTCGVLAKRFDVSYGVISSIREKRVSDNGAAKPLPVNAAMALLSERITDTNKMLSAFPLPVKILIENNRIKATIELGG